MALQKDGRSLEEFPKISVQHSPAFVFEEVDQAGAELFHDAVQVLLGNRIIGIQWNYCLIQVPGKVGN